MICVDGESFDRTMASGVGLSILRELRLRRRRRVQKLEERVNDPVFSQGLNARGWRARRWVL